MNLLLALLLAAASVPVLGTDVFKSDHVFGTAERRVAIMSALNNTCLSAAEEPCFDAVSQEAHAYLNAYDAKRGVRRNLRSDQHRRRLGTCWTGAQVLCLFGLGRRRLNEEPKKRRMAETFADVSLGGLTNYVLAVLDGKTKTVVEASPNGGWVGNFFIDNDAVISNPGTWPAYTGKIVTSDTSSLGHWQTIVDQNSDTATVEFGVSASKLRDDFRKAMDEIKAKTVTTGFHDVTVHDFKDPAFANFQNGLGETIVIDIRPGRVEGFNMYVTGDADDTIIFRWDEDVDPTNGLSGKSEVKRGGAIVPLGGLKPNRIIHAMYELAAPGGPEDAPPSELWSQPSYPNGNPIPRATNFAGASLTGYWLIEGNSKLDSGIIFGGLYTMSPSFEFKMSAGMHVPLATPEEEEVLDACWQDVGLGPAATLAAELQAHLVSVFGSVVEGLAVSIQENVCS